MIIGTHLHTHKTLCTENVSQKFNLANFVRIRTKSLSSPVGTDFSGRSSLTKSSCKVQFSGRKEIWSSEEKVCPSLVIPTRLRNEYFAQCFLHTGRRGKLPFFNLSGQLPNSGPSRKIKAFARLSFICPDQTHILISGFSCLYRDMLKVKDLIYFLFGFTKFV